MYLQNKEPGAVEEGEWFVSEHDHRVMEAGIGVGPGYEYIAIGLV